MTTNLRNAGLRVSAVLLALVIGLVAAPGVSWAMDLRTGDAVTVPAGETINDDLIAAGGTVTIAGRVTGDVYAFGETVVVTGVVDGDLISAARQVTLDGSVLGDVRSAGQQVTTNGWVGKNVTAAAERLSVSSTGQIGGSVLAGADTLTVFGPVGRGLRVYARTAQIGGPVGGSLQATVETLRVEPGARIADGLDYSASREASLPPGSVAGPVTFTQVQREDEVQQPPILNGLFNWVGLICLAGSALLGALAVKLFPSVPEQISREGWQRPLQSFGIGLVIFLLTPLVGFLVALTVIGLPLTLALALVYGLALLLAWPALGLFIGAVLARAVRRDNAVHAAWLLVVGLVTLHLVTHLPVLGGLLAFLGLVFGLGLLAQIVRSWRRSEPGAVGARQTQLSTP